MKKEILVLLAFIIVGLNACVPDPSDEGNTYAEDSTEVITPSKEVARDTSITIKAKFTNFQMGDISHYTFEDTAGYAFDFAGNEDKAIKLETEIGKDKQSDENQGWVINSEYKGKWFKVTYFYRVQPQYPDGPMTKAMIIKKLELVKP